MSTHLEDYALLSDMHTAALVSRDGCVDWLCLPRFDSPSFFTALLGGPDDGRWRIHIADGEVVEWAYLPETFVLTTTWRSPSGVARVTDFLPTNTPNADLVRRVECLEGTVTVEVDLRMTFSYARATPWFQRQDRPRRGTWEVVSLAGPDGIVISGPRLRAIANDELITPVDEDVEDLPEMRAARVKRVGGRFVLEAGKTLTWDLAWFPSHEDLPEPIDAAQALDATTKFWCDWAGNLEVASSYREPLMRSLLVLRALTHTETGGIVAAATTSLPEEFGGERNWDYRFTWLRDAALTIEALVAHGITKGAEHWRDWLLRAIAGDVEDLRIMYGLGGERDLDEKELPHLRGYEDSRPVRIGNGAADQFQADVPGEVMLALAAMRDAGVREDEYSWGLQLGILDFCERHLTTKDHGIWEMRGEPHYFTHGRVMLWAAFNEAIRAVETYPELNGDVAHWRRLRDELRAEILERGYDAERNTFTQTYGGTEVDASLLQLPHTAFLDYDDPKMLGTVAAIEEDLRGPSGLVHRYRTEAGLDGLEGDEYPFLICAFWLVEQYALGGRREDAIELMDTLVGLANDVGLLAEEYDPTTKRLAGNFPQAFSHLGLVRAADAIDGHEHCARLRWS